MKSCFGMKLNDHRATVLVKSIIILLGILALCLIYLIEKFGGVLAVSRFNRLSRDRDATHHMKFTLSFG